MNKIDADLDELSQDELELELQKALDELNDLIELQQAILGQTGIHIGVPLLNKYRSRFERDKERLDTRILHIRSRLANLRLEIKDKHDEWNFKFSTHIKPIILFDILNTRGIGGGTSYITRAAWLSLDGIEWANVFSSIEIELSSIPYTITGGSLEENDRSGSKPAIMEMDHLPFSTFNCTEISKFKYVSK